MPVSQSQLLQLWDQLHIPHKPSKQIHSEKITIIGIEVDTNELMLTLPEENCNQLLEELDHFTIRKGWQPKRLPLRDYQALGG